LRPSFIKKIVNLLIAVAAFIEKYQKFIQQLGVLAARSGRLLDVLCFPKEHWKTIH